MAMQLPTGLAKQLFRSRSLFSANRVASTSSDVPRGFLAVYIGESEKKRFVVPVSYLNQAPFQNLLRRAEEEFSFDHPMGGLTISCREDTFLNVISSIRRC